MGVFGKIMVKLGLDSSGFQKGTKDAETSTSGLASCLKKYGTQIAATMAAAFSVGAIVNFAREATALASKAEGVKIAFDKLNNPTLLDDLRAATKNSVDDLQLMQRALSAKNFKIPLDQLATYLQFATKRAQETGQSVDYLVDSIVTGLGRQSVLILDNLGISASEIRTQMEKSGTMAQAVGEIIRREMASSGDVIESAAIKTGQLSAAWTNFMVEVGKAGFFGSVKTGLATMFNDFTAAMQSKSMSGLDKFLVFTGIDRTPLLKYNDELAKTKENSIKAMKASDSMMESIKSVDTATRMLNSLNKDDTREWIQLFKAKLESYIAEDKAAKQQEIYRNNSINGIKQQIEEFKKLADEEINPKKKSYYAAELANLNAKLAKEEAIYKVKDKGAKKKTIYGQGSVGLLQEKKGELEKRVKLVTTDVDRQDLLKQISEIDASIKVKLDVVKPKTERQAIEDAIKGYENMQFAIPIGVGSPEELAAAQAEWDRLAKLIKQAREELEKYPKAPEITLPEGSIAAVEKSIAKVNEELNLVSTSQDRAALSAKKLGLEWQKMRIEAETTKKTLNPVGNYMATVIDPKVELQIDQYKELAELFTILSPAISNFSKALVRDLELSREVALDFEKAIEDSLYNTFETLFESLASLSEEQGFNSQAIVNAALSPFIMMMEELSKYMIATGIAMEAVKLGFKSLGGVGMIAAGVALAAIVGAAKGGISKIPNGSTYQSNNDGSNPNTFTGGYSNGGSSTRTASSLQLASPQPQVVVLETRVSGSDIVFAADKERMRKRK